MSLRFSWPLLPILVSPLACSVDEALEPAPGALRVCLAGDQEADVSSEQFSLVLDEATVLSDEAVSSWPTTGGLECWGTPTRALQVEDAATGAVWWIGYALQDGDGADATPALDVVVGQRVSVLYRAVLSFGMTHGVVIRDDAGVVAVLEEGAWGTALEADDHGLPISLEEAEYAREDDGCGTLIHRSIAFGAERLDPWASAPVTLAEAGGEVTAFAVINTTFEDVSCTDVAGQQAWAVVR